MAKINYDLEAATKPETPKTTRYTLKTLKQFLSENDGVRWIKGNFKIYNHKNQPAQFCLIGALAFIDGAYADKAKRLLVQAVNKTSIASRWYERKTNCRQTEKSALSVSMTILPQLTPM